MGETKSTHLDVSAFFLVLCESAKLHFPTVRYLKRGGDMKLVLPSAVLFSALLSAVYVDASQPNIVIVIADDQGYGDLGHTGNPVIKTPNIDALASESTSLTDYHVAPTCSPTRSALMTGHWTDRTGVWQP